MMIAGRRLPAGAAERAHASRWTRRSAPPRPSSPTCTQAARRRRRRRRARRAGPRAAAAPGEAEGATTSGPPATARRSRTAPPPSPTAGRHYQLVRRPGLGRRSCSGTSAGRATGGARRRGPCGRAGATPTSRRGCRRSPTCATAYFRARAAEGAGRRWRARRWPTGAPPRARSTASSTRGRGRRSISRRRAPTRANARVQRDHAENDYAVARAELNQAMGIDRRHRLRRRRRDVAAVAGEASPVGALIDEAMRARPDVAALDAQIRAQELTVRAARGGYWPIAER